ncbi:uncharacterized protein LOC112522763 [Cynara cardunculus var. scolymus]|uniref:Membrane-associated kinase regulator n=1 Tax=Cynara cardunculus var. scolymus TaxID=59895 RepID=A0A118JXU6_CYNCS|nr:uncharacterized protein LOC112522763 [Cynara cardunculus var. scolymus]KVH97601.1 hypothetical protein Ccrd_000280 [Cynara cardunculus var. scolymus]
MAIDVCSASEPFISPRISFSHDLNNQSSDNHATAETVAAATTTFDFCITSEIVQHVTSADELFFDGILLPAQIKKPENLFLEPTTSGDEATGIQKKRLKELISDREDDDDEEQEKSSSRSFWTFKRTTSLNSDSGRGTKKLFRSLSLKRLLRSNSTDSGLNPRGIVAPKVIENSNSRKESAGFQRCSSSVQTPSLHHNYNRNNSLRQSIKKKNSSGSGIKISPILNIPPAFNMNSFGFGSLFCNGKPKVKSK